MNATNLQESSWNGYKRIDFEFGNRHAILICPKTPDRRRNWLLKTEYFGAFPALELLMLERGFHVAHIQNETRWCKPSDTEMQATFIDYLHNHYGLASRCTPVGMSCGGMQAIFLSAKHPELVNACYLDAPVVNLLSCPAGLGLAGNSMWAEFEQAMGISLSALIGSREHPLDYVPTMVAHNIPVYLVAGDSDGTVPYCENGALVDQIYRSMGGEIITVVKPGCDHHPHGLEDPTPIVSFILQHS